jgi:outer membrane immunogenic protein
MKKGLLGCVATIALGAAAPALAADLPPPPAPQYYKAPPPLPMQTWQGFYIGVEGGGGWGRSEQSDATGSSGHYNVSGGLIGGTLGYNWEFNNVVLGLEGDGSWADIDGSTGGVGGSCGGGGGYCSAKLDALGTVRGRLGYAFGSVLPYITGGLAVGDLQGSEGGGVGTAFGSGSSTVAGWTFGGGLEWMFAPHWSVKAEYLHVDLGNHSVFTDTVLTPAPTSVTENESFDTDIFRVGLNYHFGGPLYAGE